jgi:hypothetical protein
LLRTPAKKSWGSAIAPHRSSREEKLGFGDCSAPKQQRRKAGVRRLLRTEAAEKKSWGLAEQFFAREGVRSKLWGLEE